MRIAGNIAMPFVKASAPRFASNAVQEISDADFDAKVLKAPADTRVVLDFWAPWCGPCRAMTPILDKVATDRAANGEKIQFYKMNVDDNPQTPAKYGVRGIPNFIVFKNGQQLAQTAGSRPEKAFNQFLDQNP